MRRDGRRGTCSRYAHSRACRPQRADHIVQRAACRAQCMARTRKRTLAREVRGARAAARPIVAAEGVLCTDAAGQTRTYKKPAGQLPCRTQQMWDGSPCRRGGHTGKHGRPHANGKKARHPPVVGEERRGAELCTPREISARAYPPRLSEGGGSPGLPCSMQPGISSVGCLCALFSCPCPLCSAQILPQCELRPTQYAAVGAARYMEASLASVSLCGGRQTKSAGRCTRKRADKGRR